MRLADLISDLFVANVRLGADPRLQKSIGDLLHFLLVALRERQYFHLRRTEPQRECAGILFYQNSQCAFITADGTAVNDIGRSLYAVHIHILHIKTFARRKIDLNGDERVFLAVHVGCLQIEFGAVKSRFVVRFHVIQPQIVQNLFHHRFGVVPCLVVIDVFVRFGLAAFGKTERNVFAHTQAIQQIIAQIQATLEFVRHLLFGANDVPVGKRELPHANQSVHFTRCLVSEFGSGFAVSAR